MALPQINRRDALVGDNLLDRALCENPAEMQHGDPPRDLPHKAHVVFNRENRDAAGIQCLDDLTGGKGFGWRHAGGRLIQQEQLWLQADRHADLKPLLLAMAEIAGRLRRDFRQIEKGQQPVGLGVERAAFEVVLKRDFEVLARAQGLEDAGHLKLDAHAASNPFERLQRGYVSPGVEDASAGRRVLAEDQAEQGALAGAVRPDQAMYLAVVERKIDVCRNVQAAKMLVETAGFENGHQARPLDPRRSRPASLAEVTISPPGATRTLETSRTPITTH